MAAFSGYCGMYSLSKFDYFPHFLKGRAQQWFFQLTLHAQNIGHTLTWPEVCEEFLRQYSPIDRRAPAAVARATLQKGTCTMSAYTSFGSYEFALKQLLRECPDMGMHDQVSWCLAGMSSAFLSECATQPDGTDWDDLDTLITFARGVEARKDAAASSRAVPKPIRPPEKPTLPAAATQVPNLNRKSKRNRAEGPSDQAQPVKVPPSIQGQHRNLWRAMLHRGWRDKGGAPYTPDTFNAALASGECLQCHRIKGTGSGQCAGHERSDGAGGGKAQLKGPGGRQNRK